MQCDNVSLGKSNGNFLRPYLKPPCKKFVLYLKEIALSNIHLEGFINDGKPYVILDVLPAAISMSYNACQEPIIMSEKADSKVKTHQAIHVSTSTPNNYGHIFHCTNKKNTVKYE
jgi:hypothetical protein